MRAVLGVGLLIAISSVFYLNFRGNKNKEITKTFSVKDERVIELSSEKLIDSVPQKIYEFPIKYEHDPSRKIDHVRVILSDRRKDFFQIKEDEDFQKDTLVLLAQLSAPVYKEHKLQASDIFINKSGTDKKIYVSYNMRGEPFIGAVQIIGIGHRFKGSRPQLLQTVIFNDFDIHSLSEKNGVLYLVGGTSDPQFKTPATLEMINLQNGLIPLPFKSKRIDLPSFAATSVIKVKNKVFVTTGDQNGGVVEIDNLNNIPFGISSIQNVTHQIYPLDDARYLDYNKDNIFCIKGVNATLWVLDRKNAGSQPHVFNLSGATIPESKSTIELSDKHLFLGLGDGGTQILDLHRLNVIHTIPQAQHTLGDNSLSVTNAVSGHFKELYTADGEEGARIFDFDNGKLQFLASISFGPGQSVNAIKYFDGYLIMATGLGGVKIVKLFRKNQFIIDKETRFYESEFKRDLEDD